MGFRELISQTYDRLHWNDKFFAETVTFTPAGSSEARRILVHIVDTGTQDIDGISVTPSEQILVLARRDADNGIDTAQDGDMIVRDQQKEPDRRPYFFQRAHEAQYPHKTRLYYSRYRREVQGGAQR